MKKWLLKDSKRVFTSQYISIDSNDYILPDGTLGKEYLVLNRPDYVLIVATTKENKLIVETNFRWGIDDFTMELPAGWIDKNEDPLTTGRRELREETGYEGNGRYLGYFYLAPSFSAIKGHVVRIENAVKVSEQEKKSDENAEIAEMDMDKVMELIKNNEINEIGTVAAIKLALS